MAALTRGYQESREHRESDLGSYAQTVKGVPIVVWLAIALGAVVIGLSIPDMGFEARSHGFVHTPAAPR